jgi:cytochrome c-type biogenesis protein
VSELINGALGNLGALLGADSGLAPAIALLAGILTSLTPCSLSAVPLAIACVGGTGRKDPKTAFSYALVFALGMSAVFTALGAAAALLGTLMKIGASGPWYIVLGILMILMALQNWGIITVIPPSYAQSRNRARGYPGALLMGLLAGLFSSPCATPVLVALLAAVAKSGNAVRGIFLLLLYSLGNSFLVVIAGTFAGFAGALAKSGKYGVFAKVLEIVLGLAILAAGLRFIWLGV